MPLTDYVKSLELGPLVDTNIGPGEVGELRTCAVCVCRRLCPWLPAVKHAEGRGLSLAFTQL